MKSYLSMSFLLFLLPLSLIVYQLVPQKHRYKVLLLMDYLFVFYFSRKMTVFLIFSTLSIHHFGLWFGDLNQQEAAAIAGLDRTAKKAVKKQFQHQKQLVMTGAVILHIGLLLVLKYSGFFFSNVNALLSFVHFPFKLPVPRFMLPIGISFYTLMAVSYLFDVYRGLIQPDKNIWRLALYLSFFPTIMEGPICRYNDTAEQLFKCEKIRYENLASGAQRILYGLFKKLVVADRLNMLIKTVFEEYAEYDGTVMLVAMVCYTIQLYMEFSGTMDAVIGCGEIFGVKVPENFRQPFFSNTISDFWARWHITLGTFFRDYIYYPISTSGPMKKLTMKSRKKIGNYYGPMLASTAALFAVWLANGIWHGDAWNYIFFGMYHFMLIFTGKLVEPLARFLTTKLHIDRQSVPYRIVQVIRTIILVNIGELFFRAKGLRTGFAMFGKMLTQFQIKSFSDGTLLGLGMDIKDYMIVGVALIIVLVMSILKEKGISVREKLNERNIVIRWAAYYAMILFVIVFGAYGMGYLPIDPIYAGF